MSEESKSEKDNLDVLRNTEPEGSDLTEVELDRISGGRTDHES